MANDAAFRKLFCKVIKTLVKADLGTKRVCPSCAARFYDLEKRPIECPKCAFTFEPESLYRQRRTRQPDAVAEDTAGTPAEVEEETAEEEEETEAAEPESTIVEPVEDEAPIQTGEGDDEDQDEQEESAESDLETEDSGMQVVEGDEVLEDLETDDVDEGEDDDTLLEEDEDDEDDVSGIIDADIEKDER